MLDAGLGDFLQQLPLFIIVMFCGSGVALLASVVLILAARRRRSQRVAFTTQPSMALMSMNPSDMPDLDDLLRGDSAPTPAPSSRGGAQSIYLSDGGSAEAVELVTVYRDITGGGLIVRMHDKVFRVSAQMTDAEFRSKLASIWRELSHAAGSMTPSASSPSSAPISAEVSGQPSAPRPTPAAAPGSYDLPKFSINDSETPMTRRDLKKAIKEPIPEIDIAGAIEAYLQHKLTTTGAFAGRGLHVRPAPDGGIRIQVDNTSYESVDDVSDAEAREFLKATISEWQERQ